MQVNNTVLPHENSAVVAQFVPGRRLAYPLCKTSDCSEIHEALAGLDTDLTTDAQHTRDNPRRAQGIEMPCCRRGTPEVFRR